MGVRELVPEIFKFMEQLYIILFLITLLGSIMVITSLNPIHSVFWLVLVFLNSSALLLLLGFNFVPLMLIIVYVGAIAILFLFVIMMLDILYLKKIEKIKNTIPLIVFVFTNIITIFLLFFRGKYININLKSVYNWSIDSHSQIFTISESMYTNYGYPFLIISLLLLVAMIGAIVLVLDLGVITKRQSLTNQHQRLASQR